MWISIILKENDSNLKEWNEHFLYNDENLYKGVFFMTEKECTHVLLIMPKKKEKSLEICNNCQV